MYHQILRQHPGDLAHVGAFHLRPGGVVAGGDGRGLGLLALLAVDGAGLFHAEQDPVAALAGPLRVGDRVVGRGRLGQAGDHRPLGQRQVLDRFAVIDLGGGFRAVGPVAQVNLVQIQLEDLLLLEDPFDLDRQHDLVELAQEALLPVEEEVARHLHGDGRAAGADLLIAKQLQGGAQQALGVDPGVFEEALVLGGQHRLDERLGQFFIGDRFAAFLTVLGDQLVIAGVDTQRNLVFHLADGAGGGQLGREV